MIETLQVFIFLFFIIAFPTFLWIFGVLFGYGWESITDEIDEKKYYKGKGMKIAVPLLVVSVIGIFGLFSIVEKLARKEIRENLTQMESPEVKINGEIADLSELTTALKDIRNFPVNQRIITSTELKVEINGMKFSLHRAIDEDSLYVVYYDQYKTTSDNHIGIITTSVLANY